MRLALVIERFEPDGGGAEGIAWNVAHGLARAGDDVRVVARTARDTPAVYVQRVRVPSAWQPLRVIAFSRAAARAVAGADLDCVLSFARTGRQDVYRAGGGSHADYLGRRYGRLERLWRLSPRHAVLLAAERRIFRDPRQRVVCNSQMVQAEIQHRYGVPDERLAVVHNGVDLERFHPRHRAAAGVPLRRELGGGAEPVWLFAGSGFARKGLDTALRALASGGSENARLWVAGRDEPAPWRRLARRLGVGGRVHFLGYRSDIAALYAAADVLLLPSRYDAFANVCLEAAAAGLPVVTSAAAGAAELLRALGGVVEDPEDVAGFSAALDRLADPALRERRGAAARRLAEAYSWDRHVAALRKQLRKVAA
jgi:UDP-glucose:(heptosyl)LPS alpha-1,3-glucosyltransferase